MIPTLARVLQDFFRIHLVAHRNVSPHTLRAYRDALVLLLRFAADRRGRNASTLELTDLDRDVVLAFLDSLELNRGNCVRTRNARLAALHSFFRYVATEAPAVAAQCQTILGIPIKRGDHGTVSCLDRAEVEHLLAAPDRQSRKGRRDAALLWFLYNTGARAQEVVDARIVDVRFTAPAQVRLRGKGRKERLCPLWPQTVTVLRHMLRDRQVAEDSLEPLFLSTAGRSMTRFGLRHIVRECVNHASATRPELRARRINPHTFRHTTALHLLQSGVELNVVRSWLGHASIQTTHAYIEIDIAMKRTALEATSRPTPRRPRWQNPTILNWLEAL